MDSGALEEAFIQNAVTDASRHELKLAERLGHGVHGIIYVAEDKSAGGKTAIKAHREAEPFQRELSVCARLQEMQVSEIRGCNVPQFVRTDAALRVIETTMVTRPFVLDFAGAYLEAPPDSPDEIWEEWEAQKRNPFDVRWLKVRAILSELERMDISMVDVSPSNIAFLD